MPNGSKLGTLCLIDVEPRELDAEERELLRDLGRMAEQELASVQLATLDELTLLSLFFDLNDFKRINDTYGHAQFDPARHASIGDLLADSDTAMYADKQVSKTRKPTP